MMNNIQVRIENIPSREPVFDDQWDPMKEDFFDPNINSYDHGPGANLDIDLQRPAYRDKNNQIVFKIMVRNIPRGLTQEGLINLFLHFGEPAVSKCFKEAPNHLVWAVIEFKTLKEAQEAVIQAHGFHGMRVCFARSDEENERIKKKKQEEDKFFNQLKMVSSNPLPLNNVGNQSSALPNRDILRMFGRGHSRGKMVMNAFRINQERRPGLKRCFWSNGKPDFRDPGGLIYDSKGCRYEGTNRVLQNIVITSSTSSRKVAMGRGYVPPEPLKRNVVNPNTTDKNCIGNDVFVPVLACFKCKSETIQKCALCGTPYCSKKCQREDFVRHMSKCVPRESIDVRVEPDKHAKFAPLSQNVQQLQASSNSSNLHINSLWGKPEKNVLSLLDRDIKAIVSISSEEAGMYHGVLSCEEVFEITNKLFCELPAQLRLSPVHTNFRPSVGTLVAVRYDDSIWRAYILNTPLVGSSTAFTVALCDLGRVQSVDAKDIMMLPSDFQVLPELSVTCELVQLLNASAPLGCDKQLYLKLESSFGSKVTAKIMSEDETTVIGVVSLTPWKPSLTNWLPTVEMVSPCMVVVSSYHHQHAIYVQPVGRVYKEQLFCLMQKVAAIHVASPQLERPPYQGEMVACQYSKDNNYYRAIILGESQAFPGQYNAFMADFGNIESVSLDSLKALPAELKACPCMAVKVSLKNVRHGPLSESAVQYLNLVLLKAQELRMEFSYQLNDGVELFFPDNSCLNSTLNEYLMPEWELAIKNGDTPDGGQVFMLGDVAILPLPKGTSCCAVTNILADGRVAVLPDAPEIDHVVNTLSQQMAEYSEGVEGTYNPRENELCLAKYQKDGMWYRAVNMKTSTERQMCTLLFVDYGNVEDVSMKDIRRMVKDFMGVPTIMSLCHIDGFPVNPSVSMVERLKELIPTQKCYQLEVLNMIGTGEFKVSIPEVSEQLKSEFSFEES